MKRTAQMQWVPTVLLLSVISIGCQPMTTDYQLAADQNISSDEIAIAIQKPLRKESQALLNALTKGAPISFRTLEIASTLLNSYVSRPVKYNTLKGSSIRLRSKNRSKPQYNHYWGYDSFRGVNIGNRVFIFKLERQQAFRHNDSWRLHSWVSGAILTDPRNGKYTGTLDQVKYYLDTKLYEPRRIAAMNKLLDQTEFAARFIPGYAGAENTFYGQSTTDRVLGVVQVIGDIATLGIGTSIKIISRTATVVTITAASTRIGVAANRFANGNATSADGIDAFLATFEAGIGAISIVKIKLTGAKAFAKSADEAALLSKHLGRSSDDILKNGISKAEMERLVGDIPELRRLKQGSGTANDLVEGVARTNPCKAFGLTSSGLCELAKLAPDVRKSKRAEFKYRDEAFSAAKKDAGGYFGKMEEIQPLYGQKRNSSSNLGRSPLDDTRNLDNSISAREYWYKNADDQIIVIQEHSIGHHSDRFIDNTSHFNVRHFKGEWKGLSEANMRDMVRNAPPPPNLPALGHYDFKISG
jgi:hypothetical protein